MVAARKGPLGVLTTKGDFLGVDGNAELDRVPIGADGSMPVADATEAVGWRWAAGAGAAALPTGYMDECLSAYTSVTVVAIGTGNCRDDTDVLNIAVTAVRSADITTTGAGGRNVDTAEQADKWYYLFIIADTTAVETEAAFLVNEDDIGAFTMPAGYDVKRRVGFVRNDAASNLRDFVMTGTGRQRVVDYDNVDRDDLNVFTDQEPIVWTAASCAEFVPPTSRVCVLDTVNDMGANDFGEWRPTGSSVGDGQGRRSQDSDLSNCSVILSDFLLSAAQSLDYRRNDVSGDGLSLYIVTYRDDL